MTESGLTSYSAAVADFRRARRRAALRRLLERVGSPAPRLLAYEDVVRRLAGRESGRWELREIPLDSIVGSVGRYKDFTRDFLPLRDSDEGRWASVKVAMTGLVGVPAIEVYQIGEAYFVLDGNHRVSVARELGATQIQAYVREVQTKAPLSPEVDLDELIIKTELADFLKRTRLDETRSDTDFTVTAPGKYRLLEHEIVSMSDQPDAALPKLAKRWYDRMYQPVLEQIRRMGMLREFPDRTETDLYVWIKEHRAELEESLGWSIKPSSAAADLIARVSEGARGRLDRRRREAWREATPPTAQRQNGQRLVSEVLVPISGAADDWVALHQADILAAREGARVLGLYVAPSEEEAASVRAQAIQTTFQQHCVSNEAECRLAIDVGRVARTICDRARWADLVVVKLNHPPSRRPVEKLSSGFRALIRGCPRPVLAVPRAEQPLNHILLAYDRSPKSDEALYLAAYFTGRWQVPLTVVSVAESGNPAELCLEAAGKYLDDCGVEYEMVAEVGPVAQTILETAERRGADLLITGGYGRSTVAEVVLGSTIDRLLRASQIPILICH